MTDIIWQVIGSSSTKSFPSGILYSDESLPWPPIPLWLLMPLSYPMPLQHLMPFQHPMSLWHCFLSHRFVHSLGPKKKNRTEDRKSRDQIRIPFRSTSPLNQHPIQTISASPFRPDPLPRLPTRDKDSFKRQPFLLGRSHDTSCHYLQVKNIGKANDY